MTARRGQVLLEDPELAEHLRGERRIAAVRDTVARIVHVPADAWSPRGFSSMVDAIGLLILDGLILRRVGVWGRFGAELLGEGELLRPWQPEDAGTTLPRTGRWRALRPCRIAVLDRDFALRMGRYPEVIAALFAREIHRLARADPGRLPEGARPSPPGRHAATATEWGAEEMHE